jgi:SAM-dependent methyltransferase
MSPIAIWNVASRRGLLAVAAASATLRYTGWRFFCPVCGGHFRKMLPYNATYSIRRIKTDHYTRNATCPYCHSIIRHRFLVQYIRQKTDLLSRPQRILHFAPEANISKLLRVCATEYITADIDPAGYPGAIFVDMTDIPFPPCSFDVVIQSHVLNEIEDDQKAIAEVYRVLKPNGHALIAVPIYGEGTFEDKSLSNEAREAEYGRRNARRLYGLDLEARLRRVGFAVTIARTESLKGNFVDRSANSPHMQSDRFLFDCRKHCSNVSLVRPKQPARPIRAGQLNYS